MQVSVAHAGVADGRPYAPGWIDRLTDRVRTVPGPAWVFYLALGVVLSAAYMVLLLWTTGWGTGVVSLGDAAFYGLLNGLTYAYLLGLVHYLDNSAGAALARFRPVLTVEDDGYSRLLYQLTTMPARPTLVASMLGVVYAFMALAINVLTSGTPMLETGDMAPLGFALVWGFNVLLYMMVAVAVYHTLHQLRLVSAIYTKHTRINLFQLGPLYALSGLTARTALGIGIPTYVWFQANTLNATGSDTPNIIQTVFLGVIIVVTFIWPLVGAHTLLEREKQRLQDDVAHRIESTIATLHTRADTGDLSDYAAQKGVLDGLLAEQGVVDKLRTWPWRTETVRGLGAAFLVPIIIWIVQRVLERLGI